VSDAVNGRVTRTELYLCKECNTERAIWIRFRRSHCFWLWTTI